MKRVARPRPHAASGGADGAFGLPGVAHMLARLVDVSRRQAVLVVLGGILLAAGSGFYASRHLSVNTDTDQMFSASLPWRQHAMAMERAFPQFQGLLVAVIDAKVPEEAEEAADDLQCSFY